ncbi:MAG: DNA-protecting protein DprA [Anaerolineae bacterium]|nr:DNA-protecting protein DprA [Anaerolineae bacterium]
MTDLAWVALSLTGRIGKKTLDALMQHFGGDLNAVLSADEKALRQVSGIGPKIAQSIRTIDLDSVQQSLIRWQKAGVRVITLPDADYPVRLRGLDDAPPTLFIRGERWQSEGRCAALVGTRSPSRPSLEIAKNLAAHLIERGYTIVSGLALGIDSAAHHEAMVAQEGHTLAVLGSGVLNIYPSEHEYLATTIMARGALVSEVQPFASPNSSTLVARNRIISGLSDCVIVIETGADGGAMHAARFATQQGRQVYAVDCDAGGNRALIDAGAIRIRPDWRDLPILS